MGEKIWLCLQDYLIEKNVSSPYETLDLVSICLPIVITHLNRCALVNIIDEREKSDYFRVLLITFNSLSMAMNQRRLSV